MYTSRDHPSTRVPGAGVASAMVAAFFFAGKVHVGRHRSVNFHDQHDRVGLHVRLRCGGGQEVVIASTHLYWDRRKEAEQLAEIEELRHELEEVASSVPLIICGDFNNVPGSGVYSFMAETFRDGRMKSAYDDNIITTSTPKRCCAIDYIWHDERRSCGRRLSCPSKVWDLGYTFPMRSTPATMCPSVPSLNSENREREPIT